jgi:hypothetical protein
VSEAFETGPAAPFIAARYVPRDRTVRVLAVGKTRGHSPLTGMYVRFGDVEASDRREQERAEAQEAAREKR